MTEETNPWHNGKQAPLLFLIYLNEKRKKKFHEGTEREKPQRTWGEKVSLSTTRTYTWRSAVYWLRRYLNSQCVVVFFSVRKHNIQGYYRFLFWVFLATFIFRFIAIFKCDWNSTKKNRSEFKRKGICTSIQERSIRAEESLLLRAGIAVAGRHQKRHPHLDLFLQRL